MERTKAVAQPAAEEVVVTKLRWRKIGGGSLHWNNKIIKPGEVFFADLEELPKSFMDTLVCLDSAEEKKQKTALKAEATVVEVLYTLKKTTGGKYNVINEEGKPLNEKPLTKEQAEELLTAIS